MLDRAAGAVAAHRRVGDLLELVDLRDMADFTLDVAWEEIRFTRQHARDFDRIALVAGSEWQEWSAWITRLFTEADMQVFEEYEPAVGWIQGA